MKTHLISISACLAVVGSLTISCNSCDNKNNDPLPGATPSEVGVDASENTTMTSDGSTGGAVNIEASSGNATNSPNANSGTENAEYVNRGSSAGSSSTVSTAVNKARYNTSGKEKVKASKSGYSAPNGTDAENHDGDPYTKNDTTSMPTGTSIR